MLILTSYTCLLGGYPLPIHHPPHTTHHTYLSTCLLTFSLFKINTHDTININSIHAYIHLRTKLLHVRLLTLQRQRDNPTHVQLGSVHMHIQIQLLTHRLDVLQSLLVVGPRATHPDLDLVLVQDGGHLAQGTDDALERGRDVGEVGDTTADEEDLAVRVSRGAQHQVEDGAGVVVGLGLGGSARVFTVVGQFADEPGRGDGVGVDDRRTAAGNEGPDAAVGVEDGELEGRAGLGVHVRDELLLLAHLAAERRREFHRRPCVDAHLVGLGCRGQTQRRGATGDGPLGAALKLGGLVELGRQIEEVHLGGGGVGVGDDDQRVDLEVGELRVDVDGVEARDEVDQDVVDALGDVLQQRGGDLVVGWVVLQVDGDEELLRFGVHITNVDTTFVSEKDPVALVG